MRKRKRYKPEFKTKAVLEVLREEGTINEIASRYEISPAILSRWTNEFLQHAPEVFKKGPAAAEKELEEERERTANLERKVGQLTYEVDWLKKKSEELINKRKRP